MVPLNYGFECLTRALGIPHPSNFVHLAICICIIMIVWMSLCVCAYVLDCLFLICPCLASMRLPIVWPAGYRVSGLGFRVQGLGFRVFGSFSNRFWVFRV